MKTEIEIKRKAISNLIKDDYGIELTWQELIALRFYVNCFSNKTEMGIDPLYDTEYFFMKDYFGIDSAELGYNLIYTGKIGKEMWKEYGLDFIRDERFKEL